MTQVVADYHSVVAAIRRLTAMGERPTAQKVIAFVGGSKTTVLRHMRKLAEETASGNGLADEAAEYVGDLLEPIVARIVFDAREMARKETEDRLHVLAELHAGMAESLEDLTRDLEAAVARADAAKTELAKLEVAMDERVEMEEHLVALSEAVHALKSPPGTSAMLVAVTIVQELGSGPSRKELQRRMKSSGFTDKQCQAARHHAVHSGYLVENGEPLGLYITEKGTSWLRSQTDTAGEESIADVG